MAGPATIEDYQTSTWSGTSTASEVTSTVTWLSGDLVAVVGVGDDSDATLGTPTATGLTFSLDTSVGGASNTVVYLWTATAGADGSSAVTATATGAVTARARGIAAFVVRSHNGIGTPATINGTTAKTISLTVVDSSSVVLAVFADWSAGSVGTADTPTDGTLRQAVQVAGRATFHLASWTAQPAATVSYGYSGGGTPDNNGIVVEVKGTAAAGGAVPHNVFGNVLAGPFQRGVAC